MKPVIFAAVVLTLASVFATSQPTFAKGAHAGKAEAKKLDKLSTELGLTDAQKSQIKTIYMGEMPKIKAIRTDANLTDDQKKEQMKPIRKDIRIQIEAILTPDQKIKWAQIRKDHKKGANAPA
ncbi:hypothetical protein CCAX7_49320 [Capsulimonas corticalis]|uniref:Uncharacterized protein n=1 Tax=Capsulimonas corticalis TaxID=2219043 RepID=A0A402CPZ1_9BACT|nr:hypothetical protein [Capsulimonas corticalis]BDI32881.1 hypothetical protein CCAX7_49320 [Capsulimonas corticalis]